MTGNSNFLNPRAGFVDRAVEIGARALGKGAVLSGFDGAIRPGRPLLIK